MGAMMVKLKLLQQNLWLRTKGAIKNSLGLFTYTKYSISIFSCYNYVGLENDKV